jgi:hypothetical protein
MKNMKHLVKRALTSWSNAQPSTTQIDLARTILNTQEFSLWASMQGRDKRHSLDVLERFMQLCPDAEIAALRGALLHDVGKVSANLGWGLRIVATAFGPLHPRLRTYLDHEAIGARMLGEISEELTIELVGGSSVGHVSDALRQADNI